MEKTNSSKAKLIVTFDINTRKKKPKYSRIYAYLIEQKFTKYSSQKGLPLPSNTYYKPIKGKVDLKKTVKKLWEEFEELNCYPTSMFVGILKGSVVKIKKKKSKK